MRDRLILLLAGHIAVSPVLAAAGDQVAVTAHQSKAAAMQVASSLSLGRQPAVRGSMELNEFVQGAAELAVEFLSQSRSSPATEALVDLLYLPLDGSLSRDVQCAVVKKGKPARTSMQKRKVPPPYLCKAELNAQCRSEAEVQRLFEQLSKTIGRGEQGECR